MTDTGFRTPDPRLIKEELRRLPRQLVRVVDYLLVGSEGPVDAIPAGRHCPVDVGNGVRLERLDRSLVERIFAACSLRGENWNPAGGRGSVQSYVRDVWAEGDDLARLEKTFAWDHDGTIWPVVHLSRLVRDNGTTTEFAVRRLVHRDGSEILAPFNGFQSHVAYRLYPDRRGWLDEDEARQLRSLVEAYGQGTQLPERVRRALRRTASIMREQYLEDAMPLLVGGFESLIKVGHDFSRAQFSQRVPSIAAEQGVALSVDQCRDVYSDRSELVHGSGVDLSVPQHLDEFGRAFVALQELLRRTVRAAIEDRALAAVFAEDDAIRKRWPNACGCEGPREADLNPPIRWFEPT